MKLQKWMFGAALVAMTVGSGAVMAQDKPAKEKPAKKEAPKKDPNARAILKESMTAEALVGKPLTEEQKTQLAQAVADRAAALNLANDAFKTNRARILGSTVEALDAKEKEVNAKAKADAAAAKAAAKPAG